MGQLSGGPLPWHRRVGARLVSGLKTWPDAAGWLHAAGLGAATLTALAMVGFSTGLYALHPANLSGMPLRLLAVLIAPAIGEEAIFRGLLVPDRLEAPRPLAPLAFAILIFVLWHLVEAHTFLPSAAPLFDRPDFLTCAALLGTGCAWIRWRTGSIWPGVALHWVMVTIWQTWLGGFML